MGYFKEQFHGNEKIHTSKLQTLGTEFENLNMKESKYVKIYHFRIKELVKYMKTHGEDIFDKKIVEKILIRIIKKNNMMQ